jgi:hypothetical protein
MLRKLMALALVSYLSMGIAAAHQYTLSFTHLVKIAVPAKAQEKDVVAVNVKIGVLATKNTLPGYGMPGENFAPFWTAKKEAELEKDGNFFRAKLRTAVTENGLSPRMGQVMISTTLTFADGEQLTLRDEAVAVRSTNNTTDHTGYSEAMAKELKTFNEDSSFTSTDVSTVTLYQRGPLPF